jgi:hypothetical protein
MSNQIGKKEDLGGIYFVLKGRFSNSLLFSLVSYYLVLVLLLSSRDM